MGDVATGKAVPPTVAEDGGTSRFNFLKALAHLIHEG
jgi:hypothetical protein